MWLAIRWSRTSADRPTQNPLVATALVIRTKTDLGQLAAKELEDWKKRGTTGLVTAVDPAAKTISIKVGMRSLTVQANEKTAFHRYSLDSAAAADATPSTVAEVKVEISSRCWETGRRMAAPSPPKSSMPARFARFRR